MDKMADHEAEGGSAIGPRAQHETEVVAAGRRCGRSLPLNSRRLTGALLKQLADGMGLPISGSLDSVRQLIDGKLEELGRDPRNVQVILQEHGSQGTHISLQDEEGVFLRVEPKRSAEREGERTSWESGESIEREGVGEEAELIRALQSEVAALKAELQRQKGRVKETWRLSCTQLAETDSALTEKDEEIARLREELAQARRPTWSS